MIVKDVAKEDFFVIVAARNMRHSRKKLLMPIRIGKSMKIHDTLYMLRKCMDGGDEDVFLFAGIILFIIFLKHFQKVFDECYREKVDSGMAFAFFRCCHGEHRERCKHCPYYVDINEETK